jgi:hypothetical protein
MVTVKCSITGQLRFKHSSRVAILVLTLPHSNDDEERVFSVIRVITKLPNSEQSYEGKFKTHNYINRQYQSTTGKL